MLCLKYLKVYYQRAQGTMYHPLRLLGFLGFSAICLYQVVTFAKFYSTNPVTVEISVIHEQNISFPAVTLCNSNKIRFNEWCKHDPDICHPRSNESSWLYRKRLKESSEKMNRSERIKLGHQKDAFIRKCFLDETSCMNRIEQFFVYEYSNCFTINAQWKSNHSSDFNGTVFRPKLETASDIIVLMDLELDERNPLVAQPTAKMTIHDPKTTPNPQDDSIRLATNSLNVFGMQKLTIKAYPGPYENRCRIYEGDYAKRTGATLSQELCMEECSAYRIHRKCGCTVPRLSMMYEELNACTEDSQMTCIHNFVPWLREECFRWCKMPCTKTTYLYTHTTVEKDYSRHCMQNESEVQVNSNSSVCLVIFFVSPAAEIYNHNAKYDSIQVFSTIGGYIGLWLGISFFTVYNYVIDSFFSFLEKHFSRKSSRSSNSPCRLRRERRCQPH